MSARSTVLAAVSITDANPHDVFVCPGNVTALLKSAYWNNVGAPAGTFTLMLRRGNNPYWLYSTQSLATNAPGAWTGWIALQPNDVIRVVTTCNPLAIWISGTHLEGVSP